MRSNASTPFDGQGWSDVINDIRTLYLAVGNGSNDMNFNSLPNDQNTVSSTATALQRSQNLKDVVSVTEAVANLGLSPIVAAVSTGTTGSFLAKASNLSDLASVSTALTNLGMQTVNFHAYGTTQNVAADPETLQFGTERSDVGGFYNSGTYIYTPSAGKYLCGFNLTVEQSVSSDTDSFRAYFNHSNGNEYGHAWATRTFINKKYSLTSTAFMAFTGSDNLRISISIDAPALTFNTVTLHEFWGVRISV